MASMPARAAPAAHSSSRPRGSGRAGRGSRPRRPSGGRGRSAPARPAGQGKAREGLGARWTGGRRRPAHQGHGQVRRALQGQGRQIRAVRVTVGKGRVDVRAGVADHGDAPDVELRARAVVRPRSLARKVRVHHRPGSPGRWSCRGPRGGPGRRISCVLAQGVGQIGVQVRRPEGLRRQWASQAPRSKHITADPHAGRQAGVGLLLQAVGRPAGAMNTRWRSSFSFSHQSAKTQAAPRPSWMPR